MNNLVLCLEYSRFWINYVFCMVMVFGSRKVDKIVDRECRDRREGVVLRVGFWIKLYWLFRREIS